MKKICEACGEEFEPSKYTPYQIYCTKKCGRIAKYFRRKTRVDQILAERGCMRCGTRDVVVLGFHHRDPEEKKFCIGRMLISCPWKQIEEEIAKCDILCANCHMRVHHEMREKEEIT